MSTVKIIKLRGETGLLQPGRLVDVSAEKAAEWVKNGWVVEIKEEKVQLETKEEKFTKKEKQTKKK